ncbi:hypothetical protein EIP86_011542 [Pleurotus ostreatoroseus]|nr:hypothetical protein EIP86_011542 [Pleurotus ostreatoroseus]
MLDRELYPRMTPDPLFVPIHGIVGIGGDMTFYWQPATMEVLRDRPSAAQVRGGILCEELGTGKTVMALALVAATLDQMPTPEDSILDYRPILTPIALRYFPSEGFADAREKLARGKRKRKQKTTEHQSQTPRIPSLVEHLIHFCRTHPAGLELREYESDLEARSLWRPLQQSAPFYYHYDDPLETQRSSRNKITRGPKRMYLTGATLIVVPPNLYNQWVNEINKHCDDRITSRVCRATNKPLPPASVLSSAYDVSAICQ